MTVTLLRRLLQTATLTYPQLERIASKVRWQGQTGYGRRIELTHIKCYPGEEGGRGEGGVVDS